MKLPLERHKYATLLSPLTLKRKLYHAFVYLMNRNSNWLAHMIHFHIYRQCRAFNGTILEIEHAIKLQTRHKQTTYASNSVNHGHAHFLHLHRPCSNFLVREQLIIKSCN